MRGGRFLSLFFAAAIFMLQGGDCVSLFFADQASPRLLPQRALQPEEPGPVLSGESEDSRLTQAQVKEKAPLVVLVELAVLVGMDGSRSRCVRPD